MIYELRIYHVHKGKMPGVIARFQDHAFSLLRRHRIQVVDFWLDAEENERLYYICAFESAKDKEEKWTAFKSDPDWVKAKAESELGGALVGKVDSFLMKQAPFFKA